MTATARRDEIQRRLDAHAQALARLTAKLVERPDLKGLLISAQSHAKACDRLLTRLRAANDGELS